MGYINEKKVIMVRIPTYLDLDTVYPVGSVYISVNNTSPASLFGGTWELIQNKFLLGTDDLANLGNTGGEAEHTLTINEMPSHNHDINFGAYNRNVSYGEKGAWDGSYRWLNESSLYQGADLVTIGNTGGGQSHNNMPPYIKVAIWKRTA